MFHHDSRSSYFNYFSLCTSVQPSQPALLPPNIHTARKDSLLIFPVVHILTFLYILPPCTGVDWHLDVSFQTDLVSSFFNPDCYLVSGTRT